MGNTSFEKTKIGRNEKSIKIEPIIDRLYPLHETGKAMKCLGSGHARGKVVIKVIDDAV